MHVFGYIPLFSHLIYKDTRTTNRTVGQRNHPFYSQCPFAKYSHYVKEPSRVTLPLHEHDTDDWHIEAVNAGGELEERLVEVGTESE